MAAPDADRDDATVLMDAAAGGDKHAMNRLLPLVYEQLRKAAQLEMERERQNHTLSATALVHEAYMKLAGPREVPWAGRAHFYAAAAEAMRRILLDHAKGRSRAKRGSGNASVPLSFEFAGLGALASGDPKKIVRFDDALCRLEAESPDGAAVVRLRFLPG